jgi:hypothetical protein
VSFTADGEFMSVIFGAPPFLNFYRLSGTTFTKLPALSSPPIGAATTFAFSGNGKFIGLVEAPPPYMSTYAGIAPYDTATEFIIPDIVSVDNPDSPLQTFSFIRARP